MDSKRSLNVGFLPMASYFSSVKDVARTSQLPTAVSPGCRRITYQTLVESPSFLSLDRQTLISIEKRYALQKNHKRRYIWPINLQVYEFSAKLDNKIGHPSGLTITHSFSSWDLAERYPHRGKVFKSLPSSPQDGVSGWKIAFSP
jgi:hypothetical protein